MYLADIMGMVLVRAVIVIHEKSASMSILNNVVTSGITSFLLLSILSNTPMNRNMISGSVGKLRLTELYRSSRRCTDRGVANAKKYKIYFGLVMVIHPIRITAGNAMAIYISK